MFYCNELPAVRRVDGGVCGVCAKEDETRFDGTRSFDMYFERSLSLVVEVTVREEEYRGDNERREEWREVNCNTQEQQV